MKVRAQKYSMLIFALIKRVNHLGFTSSRDGLNDTVILKINEVSSLTMDIFNNCGKWIYSTDGSQVEKTGEISLIR